MKPFKFQLSIQLWRSQGMVMLMSSVHSFRIWDAEWRLDHTEVKTKTPTVSNRARISLPPKVQDFLQATQQNNNRSTIFFFTHTCIQMRFIAKKTPLLKREKDTRHRNFFSLKFHIWLFEWFDDSIISPLSRSQTNLVTQRLDQKLIQSANHASNRA